jgi:hypothetical protein
MSTVLAVQPSDDRLEVVGHLSDRLAGENLGVLGGLLDRLGVVRPPRGQGRVAIVLEQGRPRAQLLGSSHSLCTNTTGVRPVWLACWHWASSCSVIVSLLGGVLDPALVMAVPSRLRVVGTNWLPCSAPLKTGGLPTASTLCAGAANRITPMGRITRNHLQRHIGSTCPSCPSVRLGPSIGLRRLPPPGAAACQRGWCRRRTGPPIARAGAAAARCEPQLFPAAVPSPCHSEHDATGSPRSTTDTPDRLTSTA